MAASPVVQFASALLYGKGGTRFKATLCVRAEVVRVAGAQGWARVGFVQERRTRWV
ncbi:MAG: hypothetical protein AAF822_17350 [Pseudomonadota bacterium]